MATANTIFSRFRIVKLLFRAMASSAVTAPDVLIGVQDDAFDAADNPTTTQDVLQLRCSAILYANQTVPVEFEWKPIEPTKWYYTSAEISGDLRFTNPATLWLGATGSGGVVNIEMHYTLEFEGAIDAT
jgi:hypothetical protein